MQGNSNFAEFVSRQWSSGAIKRICNAGTAHPRMPGIVLLLEGKYEAEQIMVLIHIVHVIEFGIILYQSVYI